ncbi:flagellar hook assembly protein FlgD [Undibacterium sp. Jales W-56]|uniref:flagellar hook assembly protein FlgD n=1 Tax=Undibacterium sp. Jales W-56 TaxID=2897325 RepID=UPI0021D0AA70|nr:flagellar hook assembly protein FlgD [Undibacterium sp. Jales W-56]MCU6433220.1 flagellar hook assembly protein FlgD [Undibacterium sp. Jales W-56]
MTAIQTKTVDPTLLASINGSTTAKTTTQEAQDRFMTLLVTQMKNQDPLNPMDNAQITSQLAQLSTVTGIDKLNATVTALNANFQASQNLQAASMIGHGVVAAGNKLGLSQGKGLYGVELTQGADKVDVTIKDASGSVVKKLSLGSMGSGINPLTWDGTNDQGAAAPDGQYQIEVSATTGGKAIDATALSFGMVSSVTSGAQGVKLNVANVGDVGLADVKKIY